MDTVSQPAALALAPGGRYLAVANGNLDGRDMASSVVMLDVEALARGIATPLPPDGSLSPLLPCRDGGAPGLPARCDARLLVHPESSLRVGSGAASLAWQPAGNAGAGDRLFVVSRAAPASLVWADATGLSGADVRLDCAVTGAGVCGPGHRVDNLRDNPASIELSPHQDRYAVIPHLEGGVLTLLDLEAPGGPAVVDEESGFFQEDPVHESGLAGGLEVAWRSCSPPDDVPATSLDCARPTLYASERYWWGLRSFEIATGLDVIVAGERVELTTAAQVQQPPRPIGGGLAFESQDRTDRLLWVQTTPPTLFRIDTSLDAQGAPRDTVMASVPLCANPNHVEVVRRDGVASLALVSCFDADRVAAIALPTMDQIGAIETGMGPDEIAVDAARGLAYVANAKDSSISVVQLDPAKPTYLREVARIDAHTNP